jgi:hypothetical protein
MDALFPGNEDFVPCTGMLPVIAFMGMERV